MYEYLEKRASTPALITFEEVFSEYENKVLGIKPASGD
jgi:hypothetical protein